METNNEDLEMGNPNQENIRTSTKNSLSNIEANELELGLHSNPNDEMFHIAIAAIVTAALATILSLIVLIIEITKFF